MTLFHDTTGILGHWYGDPMGADQASCLRDEAEGRLRRYLRNGRSCVTCRFGLIIANFWLDREYESDLESLRHLSRRSAHGPVLCDLIQGQLLMSRQLTGAMDYLDKAFTGSRGLFTPGDYFKVMKRHKLLSMLPLSATPTKAHSLRELLTTAAVIREFDKRQARRKPYSFDPTDTYG